MSHKCSGMLVVKELQCVVSYISQIIQLAGALGEAWWREVQGRRGCADGCAAVKGRGGSQFLALRLGVWGWMGSLGELEDDERLRRGVGGEVGRLVY